MNDNACFEPSPDIAGDIVEGEAILIRLEDGIYFSLNPSGSRIWQLVEQRRTIEEMAAALAAGSSVAHDIASRDLHAFLARLVDLRLVQRCNGAAGGASPVLEPFTYSAPDVEVYEDMADLLALDPPSPGRTLKSLDPS